MAIKTFVSRDMLKREMLADARDSAARTELSTLLSDQHKLKNEILKKQIIENGRIDLLATEILGYHLYEFHRKIMKFQYKRKKSLTLAPRDSGKCLKINQMVFLADGGKKPIGMIESGDKVFTLNSDYKIETTTVLAKLNTGTKPCFKIKTRTGREIEATAEHRFYTLDGWKQLKEFEVGNRIGLPRVLPTEFEKNHVSTDEAKLLGYLTADGTVSRPQFTKGDRRILDDFSTLCQKLGFGTTEVQSSENSSRINFTNGGYEFIRKYGGSDRLSKHRRIPDVIMKSGLTVKAAFLRYLFDCDGHMSKMNFEITFASKQLIKDCHELLLQFGIISRYTYKLAKCNGKGFDSWRLHITDYENLKKLSEKIGLASKQKHLDEWLDKPDSFKPSASADTIGLEYQKFLNHTPYWHRTRSNLRIDNKHGISREKLKRLAEFDKNEHLSKLAESDIFWDEIESIEPTGIHETCDIQVGNNQNFICEGFITHNSTICNYTKIIYEILKNPNIRIALVSRTQGQAEAFLKEIKNHLEGNQRLIEVFGKQVGKKWDATEIIVAPRTSKQKDPTVTCIGVGTALTGKHFDMLVIDDLINDETSRTALQRERSRVWYYQALKPTLEPDCEIHVIGTRYHYLDLYAHFMGQTDVEGAGEFRNDFIRIKAIEAVNDPESESGERLVSYYPEKHTVEYLLQLKSDSGTIVFNAQYQNDTDAMKGSMFKNEDFRFYTELPKKLRRYQGVDLAVSENENADKFAHVEIGIDENKNIFIIDFYEKKGLRPKKQTAVIADRYNHELTIAVGIESNAYQEAKAMDVVDLDSTINVKKVYSLLDKKSKGWKVSALFEQGRMFFHGSNHTKIVDHLLLFTGEKGGSDDLFDALFNALQIGYWKKGTKKRTREFGVM